jgi:hypothetical protein
LRGLNADAEQHSSAVSVTHELAVLFESLSAMLARSASAAAPQELPSAGGAAAALLPPSPYKTLVSRSPSLTALGGNSLSKSSAEISFLTISREVEVSCAFSRPCSFLCMWW